MKGNPIPVRLDPPEEGAIDELHRATGIPKAELIRRSLRLALPRFQTREADLLEYGKATDAKPQN